KRQKRQEIEKIRSTNSRAITLAAGFAANNRTRSREGQRKVERGSRDAFGRAAYCRGLRNGSGGSPSLEVPAAAAAGLTSPGPPLAAAGPPAVVNCFAAASLAASASLARISCSTFRHLATARLCSSNVSENTLEPVPLATK